MTIILKNNWKWCELFYEKRRWSLKENLRIYFLSGATAAIPPPSAVEGVLPPLPLNPCQSHPCGPNARCEQVHNSPQCSCLTGMIGVAPSCRPECISASDCPAKRGCVNQKCVDPCPGTCGPNSDCRVIDHSPVCSCKPGFIGNAYQSCQPVPAVGTRIIFAFLPKNKLARFAEMVLRRTIAFFLIVRHKRR